MKAKWYNIKFIEKLDFILIGIGILLALTIILGSFGFIFILIGLLVMIHNLIKFKKYRVLRAIILSLIILFIIGLSNSNTIFN